MISFACPQCGKNLQVKDELAGRKGKCPACGSPAAVPGTAAPLSARTKPRATGPAEEATLPPQDSAARVRPSQAGHASLSDSGAPTAAGTGPKGEPTAALSPGSPNPELYDFLAPPQAPDELGRLGPYRVLKVLGAGGMGVVFQAEDPLLKRKVALKAMLPGLAASGTAKQRFLREAQAAAALRHDHVVTIFQVGEDRGAPFLAMEFLDGEPLDERLKREGKLPVAEVLRIGREMAEGLEAAHESGLIHRDIKPANVWLERKRGRVKILDFGLARAATEASHLTQTGAIVGTPAYMAPEQAAGRELDARCDLFSLGCVLYRMCSGQAPFKGSDTISTLMAVATEQPRPPHELSASVPRPLSDLVMRLLAKQPEDRPASARAVADALEALAGGGATLAEPTRAPKARRPPGPAPSPKRAAPPASRRRTPLVVGVILGVLVLAVGGYFLASLLLRIDTDQGTLVLQADDDVVVKITQGGKEVNLLDSKTQKEVTLHAGAYQLELVGGKDGLKLETNQFVLKRGDRQIAKVVFEPRPVQGGPLPTGLGAAPPAGAVVLFDGKDLAGWVSRRDGGPADWKALKDGSLEVGRGDLQTGANFGLDYQLHVEFWIPLLADKSGQARGNSGVYLQGRYEVQILDSFDKAQPDARDCGALFGLITPSRNACKPPQEWQSFDITFHAPRGWQEGRLTVVQNGITIIDNVAFTKVNVPGAGDVSSDPGPVVLQEHGNKIRFRNLWLVPLSPGPSNPPTASADFVPLFNGKDLTGWTSEKGLDQPFSVENGVLVIRHPRRARDYLLSTREYANFTIRFQFLVAPKSGGGFTFRALEGEKMPLLAGARIFDHPLLKLVDPRQFPKEAVGMTHWVKDDRAYTPPLKEVRIPTDTWQTMDITVRGDTCVAFLDGTKIVDLRLDPTSGGQTVPALRRRRGKIGFQAHTGTLRFRDIQLKELP